MADRATIKSAILGLIPDNTNGDVSPQDERDSFDLVIDNFLNIDNNEVTNGLTLDGVSGDIKIGGSLIENTTINGASVYGFNFTDLSVFSVRADSFMTYELTGSVSGASSKAVMLGGEIQLYSYDQANFLGDITGLRISTSSGGGSITVQDKQFNKGMRLDSLLDYSNLNWAIDDSYFAPIGLIKANVGAGTDTNIGNTNLTLTGTRTLDGPHVLTIDVSGGQSQFTMNGRGIINTGSSTRIVAGTTTLRARVSGGIEVEDPAGLVGLKSLTDYSVLASLDDNGYAQYGWIKNHIGGKDVSSLVTSPTASENNFAIIWDNSSFQYTLSSVGGASITDNYIPIGNATNDGIEDSRFFMQDAGVNDTSLKWSASDYSDTSFFIRGGGGDANNTYLNLQVLDNPGNAFPYHLNTLFNKGVSYSQSRNTNTGTVTTDFHRLIMPNSSSHKVDLYNYGGVDTVTAATWFTCYGGVDYMGHKYGLGSDPRILSVSNGYSWASDNNQHFAAGGLGVSGNTNTSGAMNNNNAHLTIMSFDSTPNPQPHLRFFGDYDTANGAASNNSLYLDAVDSKLHFIGSAGQNIILEDLANATVTENVIQASWSGNTSYQYAVSFSGAQVGEFFQVLPDEDIFAAINTAGAEWNGYAYCATAGTVTVVCRVTTFINIPASSIFTVKKIN